MHKGHRYDKSEGREVTLSMVMASCRNVIAGHDPLYRSLCRLFCSVRWSPHDVRCKSAPCPLVNAFLSGRGRKTHYEDSRPQYGFSVEEHCTWKGEIWSAGKRRAYLDAFYYRIKHIEFRQEVYDVC